MNIQIENNTFERLQNYAQPFVDTPDSVINRALDALEGVGVESTSPAPSGLAISERTVDPLALPDLKHTKVLEASIDGVAISRPNWNRLLDHAIVLAMQRHNNFQQVQQICPVNMVKGRKEDDGYSFLAEAGLSVQGQSANAASRSLVTIARSLRVSVEIAFLWRAKQGAEHPGERARLVT